MFTGIIEELGTVRAIVPQEGGVRIEIDATTVVDDAELGASIAVNGCCLTVVEFGPDWWAADAIVETLDRTTIGTLAVGDPVNLERPVRPTDRLGGHVVQGHVDGVGIVAARDALPDGSTRLRVDVPATVRSGSLTRYVVEKGSITVDGASLTVAEVDDDGFAIALIPHTLAVTTLGVRHPGDAVNLEVDVLAKYVERLLTRKREPDAVQ